MLRIQPIDRINIKLLKQLKSDLEEKFPEIIDNISILRPISLAHECFNQLRGQYNSTCLLRKIEPNWITLAVTDRDLYASTLNFVFGEAELGGTRAIVSYYRLRLNADEELLNQRLLKEAIHEIGHVLGLKHCRNRNCVMSFSNSVFDVDMKTDKFCDKCKKLIKLKL